MRTTKDLITYFESLSQGRGVACVEQPYLRNDIMSSDRFEYAGLYPPAEVCAGDAPSISSSCERTSEVVDAGLVDRTRPLSFVEDIKRVNEVFLPHDFQRSFPHLCPSREGRELRLDVESLLIEVSARLGPTEDGALIEGNEEQIKDASLCPMDVPEISDNPFSVLEDEVEDGCTMRKRLGRKAKTLVKWFSSFGLPNIGSPCKEVPCGGLRKAVRDCFSDVEPVWELSFKTVQKLEQSCCKICEPIFFEILSKWKDDRLTPCSIDLDHLSAFSKAFAANVEKGWDSYRRPFIPNGNATRRYTRRDGGNWNLESFSDECRVELVFSSGKPRIVTMYSSENTRILAPLHYSLYHVLKRRAWLLVGDPTNRHIQNLNGADLLSFDYSSATDRVKVAYVREAIKVLKEKASHLSDEESAALDVLGSLKIDGCLAESGQPMGSVMSFPVLCLINKTVVDMALSRLLLGGRISFSEWSSHRLLVNGDDLLTREPRTNTNLRSLISEEGAQVGLLVNEEKTMCSPTECEINSTLFSRGIKVKKFNASAIFMDPSVSDVLKFASDATSDLAVFRKLVRANCYILAKQEDKHLDEMPALLQMICRKDKKIRRAITSRPLGVRPEVRGVIRMAPLPEDYTLRIDEEHSAMIEEIERVREQGIARCSKRKTKFTTCAITGAHSFRSVLLKKRSRKQELIPACYVRAFNKKKRDALVEEELAFLPCERLPLSDSPPISSLIDNLRAFKLQRTAVRVPGTIDASADFVSLDCEW